MEFEEPCWDFTQSSQEQQQKSQQQVLPHSCENLSSSNISSHNNQQAEQQQSVELKCSPINCNIENDESSFQEIQFALIPLQVKLKDKGNQHQNSNNSCQIFNQNIEDSSNSNHFKPSSSQSSPSTNYSVPRILNKKITSLNDKFKKHKKEQMIAYQQKINKFNHLIQGRRATKFNPKQPIGIPINFYQTIQCGYEIQIFGGICISTEYTNNLDTSSSQETNPIVKCSHAKLYDGITSEPQVIFNKSSNIIEIITAPCVIGNQEFSVLCEVFDSFNDMDYHILSNNLKRYQNEVYAIMKNKKLFQNIPSRVYAEIEEDYESFVNWARSQVQIVTKGKPFFKYVIGRMNYNLGDTQISHIGASLEFTKVLGMDYELFSQSVLRGQFCSLGSIVGSNIEQAIYQILMRIDDEGQIPEQTILLNTIDGFRMTSKQTLKKIPSPFTRHLSSQYDHLFYIELVNIEENQLKALEEFRQRQLDNQKGISFEQYAHRELSQFFEIVEYSVYSQIFLEKYYSKKQ